MNRKGIHVPAVGLAALAAAGLASAAIVVGPPEAPPSRSATGVAVGAADETPLSPGSDRLTLTQGEWLRGDLVGLDTAAGRLMWRHPDVREPIAFSVKAVSEIRLGPRRTAPARESGAVRLTNGDELVGEIASVDPTNIVLSTASAGRLAVPRCMVADIRPGAGTLSVLYEGPKDLAEWKHRGGNRTRAWEVKDGVLSPLQPVPIGRSIEAMPDAVRIDFTAQWRNPGVYFSFWFFHEKPDEPQGDAYMMNIVGGQRVDLHRQRLNGGAQNLGSIEFAQDREKPGPTRFSILADRSKGNLALLVNGKLLKQWKDTRDFKGDGKAITFMPQGGRELAISEIRVAKWNGILPQLAESAAESPDDSIVLANGDVMSGTLIGIADGQAAVKTPFADLKIPLERVTQISMAGAKSVRARRRAGDVRAWFAGGGRVTFDLKAIANGRLEGSSENFGAAAWPLAAFDRVEMNIYSEKATESDDR